MEGSAIRAGVHVLCNGVTTTCAYVSAPVVIKVLEKLVYRNVASSLEGHGLLSDHQHGFRARQSTVGLLSEAVHDWALALQHRSSVHSLFLDLAKAFDSMPHYHLFLGFVVIS